jgi:hypothetical protein
MRGYPAFLRGCLVTACRGVKNNKPRAYLDRGRSGFSSPLFLMMACKFCFEPMHVPLLNSHFSARAVGVTWASAFRASCEAPALLPGRYCGLIQLARGALEPSRNIFFLYVVLCSHFLQLFFGDIFCVVCKKMCMLGKCIG